MKMLIEVFEGNITNIVATEEISIHIVDHDNLSDVKANDNQEAQEVFKEVFQAQQPDKIIDNDSYIWAMSEAMEEYISMSEAIEEYNKRVRT